MTFLTLLRVELEKLYRRPGPYIGYGVAAVGAALMVLAAKAAADYIGIDERVAESLDIGPDLLVGARIVTGPFVAYAALKPGIGTMGVFFGLPLVVCIVTANQLVGERRSGSLRMLLTRPISRGALVAAKMCVIAVYAVSATLVAGAFSLGLSLLLYGNGPVFLLQPGGAGGGFPQALSANAALWRLAAAYGVLALAMVAVGAIALLFSSFANNGAVAVVLTISLILVSVILDAIPGLEWLRPCLLSHHITGYSALFEQPILKRELLHSVFALLLYAGIPFVAALVIVERRDVTC